MHMNLRVARSGDRFLEELAGVDDPETKRKRIGETFISVFEETAIEIARDDHGVDFLVQGTTYPDVVESAGSGHGSATAIIKSHHNVGGLPDDLRFELIEPCDTCSRTRSARSAANWACPRRSSVASRILAPASPFGSSAPSPTRRFASSSSPTPS